MVVLREELCQAMHWKAAPVTQGESFVRGMTLVLARLCAGYSTFAMGRTE